MHEPLHRLRTAPRRSSSTLLAVLLLLAGRGYAMSGFELKAQADAYERSLAPDFDFGREGGVAFGSPAFIGYVAGVRETLDGISFCIPPQATNGQVNFVVSRYLHEHPDELAKPANELVVRALGPTFPCAAK